MNQRTMTIQELAQEAGVTLSGREYQPANIGRGAERRPSTRTFARKIMTPNFDGADALRTLTPERVHERDVFSIETTYHEDGTRTYNGDHILASSYKGIVGDNTGKVYSIRGRNYTPIQHADMIEALALTSEDTGVRLFGGMQEKGGIMNLHAFFADPSFHVDFEREAYAQNLRAEAQSILGVRIYNGHDGLTGFGAEIFGIRSICTNYMAFGTTLGHIRLKHFKNAENTAQSIESLIKNYMKGVPKLADRMHRLSDGVLTIDEATALLYGINLQPSNADAIIGNLRHLNPEIGEKMTPLDVYNAATAYISHRTASDNSLTHNLAMSKNAEKILEVTSLNTYIDNGIGKIEREMEKRKNKTVNLNTANISIFSEA